MDFLSNILNLKAQEPDQAQPGPFLSPLMQQPAQPTGAPDPSTMPAPVAKILKSAGVSPQEAAQHIQSVTQPPPMSKQDMFNQRLQDLVGQQKAGVTSLEDQYNNMKGPQGFNPIVGTLAAASDILGNGQSKMLPQLLQSQAQQSQAFDDKKMKYLEQIQKSKGDLSKENIALLGKQISDEKAAQGDSQLKQMMMQSTIDRNNAYVQNNTGDNTKGGLRDKQEELSLTKDINHSIDSNPIIRKQVQQIQGLDNASKIIADAPTVDKTIFNDYQQAVIGAMQRGNSGLAERMERHMKSAGIDASSIAEYFAGRPVAIPGGKDNPMVKAIQGFAKTERGNVQDQVNEIIDAASGGRGTYLEKYPNLKKNVTDKINTYHKITAPKADSAGPKPGTIEDNHVFLGGNPSDPASWKEVGQ